MLSYSFEVDGSKRITYGIKMNAFKDNTNMKSVDIPATVKFISANSFVGCTNLETIIFRATDSNGLIYFGGFVDVDKETITVKVANDEIEHRREYRRIEGSLPFLRILPNLLQGGCKGGHFFLRGKSAIADCFLGAAESKRLFLLGLFDSFLASVFGVFRPITSISFIYEILYLYIMYRKKGKL